VTWFTDSLVAASDGLGGKRGLEDPARGCGHLEAGCVAPGRQWPELDGHARVALAGHLYVQRHSNINDG
jgi:hypothetical protein